MNSEQDYCRCAEFKIQNSEFKMIVAQGEEANIRLVDYFCRAALLQINCCDRAAANSIIPGDSATVY